MEPWYKAATPRREVREERLFNPDEFAIALGRSRGRGSLYSFTLTPVRTGRRPLARTMGWLLTGDAGAFNRRHRRHGHLFQNRYKSILVEEEPYLLELTRYIHLNPLRAGAVRDLAALDRYPWTGHSVLMEKRACPQQVGVRPESTFALSRPWRISAHDGAYLTLAEQLDGAVWTGDRAFCPACRKKGSRVRWIGDYRMACH